MLRFSLAFQLRLFAGGHRGVVTPVPIPNTEVKGSFAEGSAGLARARVGRRRLFYFHTEIDIPTGCLFLFGQGESRCRFRCRGNPSSNAPLLLPRPHCRLSRNRLCGSGTREIYTCIRSCRTGGRSRSRRRCQLTSRHNHAHCFQEHHSIRAGRQFSALYR